MAVTRTDLRHVLSKDDADLVEQARQPGLSELTSDELRQLSIRLRERRDRSNKLVSGHRRATKGRSNTPVEKFEANQRRHAAIYAEAVARTNKERSRRTARARHEELVANSRRALALRQAGEDGATKRPAGGATASAGMKAKDNAKTRKVGAASQKGRVSQATKAAQAKRDTRGA